MHLSSYGLISLKGTVAKPEPGLGFADYQVALAHYGATLALRARTKKNAEARKQPASTPQMPTRVAREVLAARQIPSKPRNTAAAALVRKFRG